MILKEEYANNVSSVLLFMHVVVKRVSDRVMSVKLEIEGALKNAVSRYITKVCCWLEEKETFWREISEEVESIPREERMVTGGDFNGHVGEGNRGDEEVIIKKRNMEGKMVVENDYFQNRE